MDSYGLREVVGSRLPRVVGDELSTKVVSRKKVAQLELFQLVARTGQTISFIMRKVLIAISNSATISSEGLIAELHNVWSY